MDLVALLKDYPTAGLNAVLAFFWFKEWRRAERLETERAALLERVLNGLNAAAVAVTGATASIDTVKDLVSTSIENRRSSR